MASLGVRFDALPGWMQDVFEQFLIRSLNNAMVGTVKNVIRDYYRMHFDWAVHGKARTILLDKIREADSRRIFRQKVDYIQSLVALHGVGFRWKDLPADIQQTLWGVLRYTHRDMNELDIGLTLFQ
jgi:hypothetical protein